jgi:hypothetical protein
VVSVYSGSTGTHLARIGSSKDVSAQAMNFFKSVLLIPPIGFRSALEQLCCISWILRDNGKFRELTRISLDTL